MFDIKDYLIINTTTAGGLDQNPTITAKVTIDQKKIEKDINLFGSILQQLEKAIGPYSIKVDSRTTKIKKKKKKHKK